MPTATLFIPTWNGLPELEDVLRGVERQPGAHELERYAIDSGSSDGTIQCLKDHGFRVDSIPQLEFNHGTTRDLGIQRTEGEIICLLTQDAIPANEQWLEQLLGSYDDTAIAAAYCRQLPRDDCNPFIAHRLREWTAGKTEPVIQRLEPGQALTDLEPLQRLQLCAFDNVASSLRRTIWDQFRYGYRRFGEDVALGKRLIESGHSILFQARSEVIHSHNRSPRAEGQRIYCDHSNLRALFDVHLVPDAAALRGNIEWAQREYGRQVDELGLPPEQHSELRQWAVDYAKWSAFGMYWGGNFSDFQTRPRAERMQRLDDVLRRGI